MEVEDFFTETMARIGGSGGRGGEGGKEGGEWYSGFGMLFWVGGVWRGDEVTIPTWTKNEQVIS